MIISIIIFIASAIFIALIIYNQRVFSKGGSKIFEIGSDSLDKKISDYHTKFRTYINSIDSVYIKKRLHDLAESAEKISLLILEKIAIRLSRAKGLVFGKDLPKNRGSASFLFKHIEQFKEDMDRIGKKIL